jgi:tRNA(fMet)-specific endonuclease VapC
MGFLDGYLLHTDTVVDLLRGRPATVEVLQSLAPARGAISVVSIGDLVHAARLSSDAAESELRISTFLDQVAVHPVDRDVAWTHGQIRSRILREEHRVIDDFDLILAATAIVHDLTLLTRHERWFEAVVGLRWSAIPAK